MDCLDFDELVANQLEQNGFFTFQAKITPSAPKTKFLRVMSCTDVLVKIAVSAPPEKGKANTELIRFLSKYYNCQVQILRGETGSMKLIRLIR
jgi:uncharacterized protein (TIGR00251 family)